MKERFEFVTLVVSLLVIGVMLGAVAVHFRSQERRPESADPSTQEPVCLPCLEHSSVRVDGEDELARTRGRLEQLEKLHADHVGFLRCTTDYWRTHYERGTKPGDLPPIGCASPPPPAISTRHLPATRSSPSYSVPPGCRLFRTGLVCDRAVSDEEIEGLEEMRK